MTLPFLNEDTRTANQIPNVWSTSQAFDSIELGITNGDRIKFGVNQINSIFYVKLNGSDTQVCMVISLTDDTKPKRFIIRSRMATDLINHVNRRRFLNGLSHDEQSDFFRGCR